LTRVCYLLFGLLLTAPAYAGGFDFAALQSLLQRGNAAGVDELIAALPFTLRSRYTLVFDSRSLQGATFRDPRVILYGPDAHLVVTFNGDSSQRGFQTVETMEFEPETREFRFRELQFPQHGSGSTAVSVSEVNPERCARCHGTPARPLWDTHPLWPGAYGEHYGGGLSAAESAGLTSFLAQQPQHPRYRNLLNIKRFAEPATFRETAARRYSGTQEEPPNAELANLLTQLQFQSITRNLARQARFPLFQYALLGISENACGPVEDFYPSALWRAQRSRFQEFARATTVANSRQSQLKDLRAVIDMQRHAAGQSTAAADNLAGLRYVTETGLGISTRGWSLALEAGTYDFTLSPFAMVNVRDALLAEVASHDERVRELSLYATSSDGDRYCNYLKRRSRAALQEASTELNTPLAPAPASPAATASPAAAAAPAPTAPPVAAATTAAERHPSPPGALTQCINCHESGAAPLHPFSRPELLQKELRAHSSPHGTLLDEIRFRLSPDAGARGMPLGMILPENEKQTLLDYFAALASSAMPYTSQLEQLPDDWRDDSGQSFQLGNLRGQRLVLTMAYASCHRICPLTMQRLQELQAGFDSRGTNAQFVIVGYDPEADDPATWHQYRQTRHLTRGNWHFLVGNRAAVEQTARQLGFPFWRYDQHVMHESRIVYFNEQGAVVEPGTAVPPHQSASVSQ
jgi:protein SCO1/2